MTLTIDPATRDDLPFIEDALRDTWEAHRARQRHAFAKGDLEANVLPDMRSAFHDPDGQPSHTAERIFMARQDGAQAGYITLSAPQHHPDHPPPFVNIDDIYVAPAFRRQGVAQALLEHVRTMADDADWDNLTATVWAGNTASEALFAKAGFTQNATNLRYGPDRQVRDHIRPQPHMRAGSPQSAADIVLFGVAALFIIGLLLTFV